MATKTKLICELCEKQITDDYVRAVEGGSIPDKVVCAECMNAEYADEEARRSVEYLRDIAITGEGHDCLWWADETGDLPVCGLCGLVLERAGDALVVPH